MTISDSVSSGVGSVSSSYDLSITLPSSVASTAPPIITSPATFTTAVPHPTFTTAVSSTVFTETEAVFPTVSSSVLTMGDDGDPGVLTAALTMSIVAILFSLFMLLVLCFVLYILVKLRNDVKSLRISQSLLGRAENGSSIVAETKLDGPMNRTIENEMSLDQKPPPSPGTPKKTPPSPTDQNPSPGTPKKTPPSPSDQPPSPGTPKKTTTPQYIPHVPPGPGYEDIEPTVNPTSPRDNYDNVNLLEGILPAELRTEDNLEGQPLSLEEVQQLQEHERRKELQYEEVEMRKRREKEALETARMVAKTATKQVEGTSDDIYTDPADAIKKEEKVLKAKKKGSQKRSEEDGKKFKIGTRQSPEVGPSSYTDVFDVLPSGEREVVKQKKLDKGVSDTSQLGEKSGNGATVTKRMDAAGYEDIPDDMFKGASSAPIEESPLSEATTDIHFGGSSPWEQRKAELSKRNSHPSRRESRKEMVEVNPQSRKPVTLSSGRRKQRGSEGQQEEGEGEGIDGEVDGDKTTIATDDVHPETHPASKPKEFNILGEASAQDSYAIVDMTGKFRYRAESDAMKKEGAGAPKHYTVKERPPEENRKREEVVKA